MEEVVVKEIEEADDLSGEGLEERDLLECSKARVVNLHLCRRGLFSQSKKKGLDIRYC